MGATPTLTLTSKDPWPARGTMAATAARTDSATAVADSRPVLGISAARRSPEIRADRAAGGSPLARHSATLTITSSPTCMPKVSLITCSRSMSRYRMLCATSGVPEENRTAACRSKAWRVMSPVLGSYCAWMTMVARLASSSAIRV